MFRSKLGFFSFRLIKLRDSKSFNWLLWIFWVNTFNFLNPFGCYTCFLRFILEIDTLLLVSDDYVIGYLFLVLSYFNFWRAIAEPYCIDVAGLRRSWMTMLWNRFLYYNWFFSFWIYWSGLIHKLKEPFF